MVKPFKFQEIMQLRIFKLLRLQALHKTRLNFFQGWQIASMTLTFCNIFYARKLQWNFAM